MRKETLKERQKMNKNKGITLISLVITIIVLLILAGVSIGLLTGDNGILNQAEDSSSESKKAAAEEKVKVAILGSHNNSGDLVESKLLEELWKISEKITGLETGNVPEGTLDLPDNDYPITVTVDGYDIEVEKPDSMGTTAIYPDVFLPDGAILSPNTDEDEIEEGLVMTLDGNEFVWIPMPEEEFSEDTKISDHDKIEEDINRYVSAYKKEVHTDPENSDVKDAILESIYEYNGFWVGRYESGISETIQRDYSSSSTNQISTMVVQKDKFVYNYVTIGQATTAAKTLSNEEYNSSLMFGFQWDLILKFMQISGDVEESTLLINSTNIGNHRNTSYQLTSGKYQEYIAGRMPQYLTVESSVTKAQNAAFLLTTGATITGNNVTNEILNIYDLAGNAYEFTLENSNASSQYPIVSRGGNYLLSGMNGTQSQGSVATRRIHSTTSYLEDVGFRVVLY